MSIRSRQEYELTRNKLAQLRELLGRTADTAASEPAKLESRRSLRRYENQLVEELRRYEIEAGLPDRTRPQPLSSR